MLGSRNEGQKLPRKLNKWKKMNVEQSSVWSRAGECKQSHLLHITIHAITSFLAKSV